MELSYELTVNLQDREKHYTACKELSGFIRLITEDNHFAQDKGGRLYYYKNGVYNIGAEDSIGLAYKQIIDCLYQGDRFQSRKILEIIKYVRLGAPILLDRPELNRINLLNGIYNVMKGKLEPHDPSYRTTTQLNVSYDTKATCPEWDKFVSQVFPDDHEGYKLGYEIAAWLMVPFTSSQRSVVLLGSGANGKSIYLNGLQAFLGRQNVCNVPLQKLGDRFTTAQLLGKLANISPDLPNHRIIDSSTFKSLTGGDTLLGEYKGGSIFNFEPFCRCVFACNELPGTDDLSDGFFRRLNVIEFPKRFKDSPEEGKRLAKVLTSPNELSGLLNRCIEVLPQVLANGISVTESMASLIEEHRKETDPNLNWILENTVLEEDAAIPSKELFDKYTSDFGEGALNHIHFGRKLLGSNLNGVRKNNYYMFDGERQACYLGIRLKEERDEWQEGMIDIPDTNMELFGDMEEQFSDVN